MKMAKAKTKRRRRPKASDGWHGHDIDEFERLIPDETMQPLPDCSGRGHDQSAWLKLYTAAGIGVWIRLEPNELRRALERYRLLGRPGTAYRDLVESLEYMARELARSRRQSR